MEGSQVRDGLSAILRRFFSHCNIIKTQYGKSSKSVSKSFRTRSYVTHGSSQAPKFLF